jgi:uncharacterized Tic20 family protein/DNA-binding Xre family transcriptional regulator
MNQPYLGQKIAELRQLKGLTQEQLAEKCEVSARTIQRIESGEVDPRAYTLHCLSEALEFDFAEQDASREDLWLLVLHLSSVFCLLIVPLLMWSWKKNQSLKIDTQGRQVLNFQITMTLLLFAGLGLLIVLPVGLVALDEAGWTSLQSGPGFMLLTLCAPLPMILIGIYCTILGVLNAVRALSDKPIRYPLSIPFVK